jgi:hypothetical protein
VKTNKIDIAALIERFPVKTDVAPTRMLSPEPRVDACAVGTVREVHQFSDDPPMFRVDWEVRSFNDVDVDVRTWHYAEDLITLDEYYANGKEFGGHEFEYDQSDDLVRCVYCNAVELIVRDRYTNKITPCAPSPVETTAVSTVADTTALPAVDAVQFAQRVRATADAALTYLHDDPLVVALVPVLTSYAYALRADVLGPRAAKTLVNQSSPEVEHLLTLLDERVAPRRAELEATTAEYMRTMDLVTAVTRDEYGWPATGRTSAKLAGALHVFLTPTPAGLPSTYAADALAAALVELFGAEVVGEDAHAAAVTLLDRIRTGQKEGADRG